MHSGIRQWQQVPTLLRVLHLETRRDMTCDSGVEGSPGSWIEGMVSVRGSGSCASRDWTTLLWSLFIVCRKSKLGVAAESNRGRLDSSTDKIKLRP